MNTIPNTPLRAVALIRTRSPSPEGFRIVVRSASATATMAARTPGWAPYPSGSAKPRISPDRGRASPYGLRSEG